MARQVVVVRDTYMLDQEIYKILVKRKYNRAKPYLPNNVFECISNSIKENAPLKLIGFWGVGPKKEPNWADKESCEFLNNLNNLNNEIKSIYKPGIQFTFIFATLHGIHNGYNKEDINSYIEGIKIIFNKYNFDYIYLDSLWSKYGISFKKINKLFTEKSEGWWNTIPEHELIEKNAENRNKIEAPEIAAQKYFIMRTLEKEMFQKEFKDYVFHAFSDPDLQIVLPNMPILYFYGRESWPNAPWFVDFDKK
jgi:hypothetical protein